MIGRFLRSVTRPPNSLILVHDFLSPDVMEEFEAQIDELSRYYDFGLLSQLKGSGKLRGGFACIAFENARAGTFISAVPILLGRKIPFNVFVQPETIGTNRLPAEEELRIYHTTYPEKFPAPRMQALIDEVWEFPSRAAAIVTAVQKELGAFPFHTLSPEKYMTTWGKMGQIPKDVVEFGIRLAGNPSDTQHLHSLVEFMSTQIRTRPRWAMTPRSLAKSAISLEPEGIFGLIGPNTGIVEPGTSPWELPRYEFRG